MPGKDTHEATIRKRSDQQDLIDIRRAKVLELHVKGLSERAIADKLLIGKSTVHDDLQYLRDQAALEIESHITNIPFHHKRALTIVDIVLKELFVYFDKTELELADRLDVMKMILETTEFLGRLITDSNVIDRCVKHAEGLKSQLEAIRKKDRPRPKWEVVTEMTDKGNERKGRKLTKQANPEVIV